MMHTCPCGGSESSSAGVGVEESHAEQHQEVDSSVTAGGCPRRAKRGSEPTELATTAFRLVEKKYKLYRPDTHAKAKHRKEIPEDDFSEVVDMRYLERNTPENAAMIHRVEESHDGGRPCYTFSGVPGLLIFPGAVSEQDQRRWCRAALEEYSVSKDFPNNITTLGAGTAETHGYIPDKMRWATLGFRYNWTSRTYDKSLYVNFPSELNDFMCGLVERVADVTQDEFHVRGLYQSQTAIVNYFPVGSMMMAHQDISEVCLDKPLMSMSLGCSCIFLMGTDKREDKPHAFLLRSGDVAAFTGPSRTAFHSVPRILDDCPPHLLPTTGTDTSGAATAHSGGDKEEFDAAWRSHMQHLRININVRQVYDERCDFLFPGLHHSPSTTAA